MRTRLNQIAACIASSVKNNMDATNSNNSTSAKNPPSNQTNASGAQAVAQSINGVKAFQKPQDSIFSTLFTRRVSRVLTYTMLRWWPSVSPSQVSTISFVLAVVACGLFLHTSYWWRLVGVVLLQLSFAFDCSDGEIARAKHMSTPFGAWLDSTLDRFKEVLMLGSMTIAWYWHVDAQLSVIAVGALAIIGLQLVSFVREAKKSTWTTTRASELFITKNIYIGTVDVTVYLVSAAVLFSQELIGLWIFALVSVPLLMKQLASAFRLHRNG